MSISQLMAMRNTMPKSLSMDLSPRALEAWNPSLKAQVDDKASISIFGTIGYDYYTGDGVTANRIAAALRSIGAENDVNVYINSPGGDMFEGIAIKSLLDEHKGKVTVKVIGLAASSASIVAMGGDEIQMARAAFLMIHNCWVCGCGNRNQLREIADWLEPFDEAMADVYADRTGGSINDIQSLMDKETWLGGSRSIELGFADSIIDVAIKEGSDNTNASALRKMEAALARAGLSRGERRSLMSEFNAGKPGATGKNGKPGAVDSSRGLNIELGSLSGLSSELQTLMR